jgi:hypothetical protein
LWPSPLSLNAEAVVTAIKEALAKVEASAKGVAVKSKEVGADNVCSDKGPEGMHNELRQHRALAARQTEGANRIQRE